MCNSSRMQIVKSFYNLPKKLSANWFLYLSVSALLFHVLMKRNSLDHVSYDADLLSCFDQIVHFDDMWMVNFLKGHYFTLNGFSLHGVVELGFLVNFNSKFSHVNFVITDVHDSVRSLTDWFADLIIFKNASLNCLSLQRTTL